MLLRSPLTKMVVKVIAHWPSISVTLYPWILTEAMYFLEDIKILRICRRNKT